MICIERKINGVKTAIGWIENVERCEWLWTCFDKEKLDDFESFSQGCATSRRDAESEVRKEFREQF